MRIAFHSNQLGERGTEICLYKYAKYNREILGNESIIISSGLKPTPSLNRFKDFTTILYQEEYRDGAKNDNVRTAIEKICDEQKIDAFYAIKAGENDGIMPTNTKSLAHCVFRMHDPHADVYSGVCKYISEKFGGTHPYVHHILEKEAPDMHDTFREEFDIPKDALVLGRHGGRETFNLSFVYPAIKKALEDRKDLWFVFLNTDKFIDHERVIHLPWTMDEQVKAKFVNTCDAMMHARADGEIFSLSVAEFTIRNKPVISWLPKEIPHFYDYGHIYLMQNKAIYYDTAQDLYNILCFFDRNEMAKIDWNGYTANYTPEIVMQEFKDVYLT
jgi:hypothetical protein